MKTLTIYTDGSFRFEKTAWAFIVLENEEIIYEDYGVLEGQINELRQIGGELGAAMRAILYCKKKNAKAEIFADYIGVRNWLLDLFGGKPWKTNKIQTAQYREFMLKNKDYIADIKHVPGHQGHKWNEYVDELAANAYNNF